jgi:kanamycin kinase
VTDRFIAAAPSGPVAVPAAVLALAAGELPEPVWRNEAGGLTFALRESRRYVKWHPPGFSLAAEAARLAWASSYTPVPVVLESGVDDEGSWLVTAALPGDSAVSPRWLRSPAVAARAIGEGLRAMHDSLPVESCPFDWGVAARLARADEADSGSSSARPSLGTPPPVDQLVVCHGDACAPNTLIDESGRWSGHVGLGALGVADRWADLAVATWSLEWNYGPGWDGALLEGYGIEPDDERTDFYRRLWDAT